MSNIAVKSSSKSAFPKAKVTEAVRNALPSNATFEVRLAKSSVAGAKIVRVITEAWKSKRPLERVTRVLPALNESLSPKEQDSILRISVLTRKEYDNLVKS
jgi:hypothetical protein